MCCQSRALMYQADVLLWYCPICGQRRETMGQHAVMPSGECSGSTDTRLCWLYSYTAHHHSAPLVMGAAGDAMTYPRKGPAHSHLTDNITSRLTSDGYKSTADSSGLISIPCQSDWLNYKCYDSVPSHCYIQNKEHGTIIVLLQNPRQAHGRLTEIPPSSMKPNIPSTLIPLISNL